MEIVCVDVDGLLLLGNYRSISLAPKPENMAFHRSLRSTVLQLIDELNERELGRTIALLLLAMEQPIILRF